MDTPLLALTRRRAGAPGRSGEAVATENMRQLVQLRWIAVAGQVATIVAVQFGLGVPLPLWPMLAVAALLALANFAVTLALPRHRFGNAEILLALLLDMAALTLQLYFSGGATNPFIALYLLQVALGAILLDRWSVWVLVAVTTLCYALLSVTHVPLRLPRGLLADAADLYTLGNWLSFAMVATLLGMFITRIGLNLRVRDRYLADLRQNAVEEESIVRMGLFASGAAHELGTPLGTLSVILADWRRMPKLATDPELAGEIAEMQAEVQRCKAIVTDILHSAGQPRGDALESVSAGPFLDEIADSWRPTHWQVPLDYARDPFADRIAADPALRQAVWNLLDNAAEVSPGGVGLYVTREAGALVIAVRDRGAGFAPGQLANLGKLYHSSKGAGHGLGLFLATNVARRIGGMLEARNLPEGGAEVRLILPLVPAGQREGRDG